MFGLGSLLTHPVGIRFKDQEAGEEVILLVRQHIATKLSWSLRLLLMVASPPLVYWGLVVKLDLFSSMPLRCFIVAGCVWYLLSVAYAFTQFLHWFFNLYIVTDRRIIDIDYWGFLHYEISEASLRSVQDVTYNVKGAMGVLFNYGNVYVQTAAAHERVDFISVPSPEKVHDIITDLVHASHV